MITFQPVSDISEGGKESQKIDYDSLNNEIGKLIKIRDSQKQGLRDFDKGFLKISGARGYLEGLMPYFKNMKNKTSCFAGNISTYITAEADVLPCYQIRKPIGNLYDNSFSDIWNSKKYNQLRKEFFRRDCENCWWICHNGRNIFYNNLLANSKVAFNSIFKL